MLVVGLQPEKRSRKVVELYGRLVRSGDRRSRGNDNGRGKRTCFPSNSKVDIAIMESTFMFIGLVPVDVERDGAMPITAATAAETSFIFSLC